MLLGNWALFLLGIARQTDKQEESFLLCIIYTAGFDIIYLHVVTVAYTYSRANQVTIPHIVYSVSVLIMMIVPSQSSHINQ